MASAARLALAVLLLLGGCVGRPAGEPARSAPEGGDIPRIRPPDLVTRAPVRLDPNALPTGARAHFPAFDGDRFFVTLPATARDRLPATEVLAGTVEPVLRAVGFDPGIAALALPPSDGVTAPRASLKALALALDEEYASHPKLLRPRTRRMIEAFLGRTAADAELDRALQLGRGMTFRQFVHDIERAHIQYPFRQVVEGVPIEHAGVLATRWEGEGVTAVRGALVSRWVVANRRALAPGNAVAAAIRALGAVKGIEAVTSRDADDGPHLVLLPYGTDTGGAVRLRYAWRLIVHARALGQEGPFLVWVDTESRRLLKLEPLMAAVAAVGRVFNRDPGGGTRVASFEVDPALGGQYRLQKSGTMNRVDYQGPLVGGVDPDVGIGETTNGSSSNLANFDQAPIDDDASAMCASATNKGFQQVNVFATIFGHHRTVVGAGIFAPFPRFVWTPQVESPGAGCGAWWDMRFGVCGGYQDGACPNFSDGTANHANMTNFAHDNTVVAHEVGHSATWRLTIARPADWCGAATCQVPQGWGDFHDLADFWGAHLESSDCVGGWVARHVGGVNASHGCALHSENDSFPRLLRVPIPYAGAGDHFPEHRGVATGEYADGQIPGAALWAVRVGMRSKCRPSGLPQFTVRFQRALQLAGFLLESDSTDRGLYQRLYDLQVEMMDQWATSGAAGGPPAFAHNGAHTAGKVAAGFAAAGLFLIPWGCLDGNAASACPGGESGADAVIDIDDREPGDDLDSGGVIHPEVDFLRLGGPAPSFRVWTGPRYRLDGPGGAAALTGPAPCNREFEVEASTDPTFPSAATVTSGWQAVAPASSCYGEWVPDASQWTTLQAGGALSRVYYRVRTRDAAGGHVRLSTAPGNGLWTVPPPYAVLTVDGMSDY